MRTAFITVRTEGGILPADLLMKIVQRDSTIGGVSEDSYHVTGEKLNEAISRSWNRLLGVWKGFEEAAAKLPSGDFGTSITREKWLLPLFEELHYGRLKARTFEIEGTTVPISHGWENVPIHLVGFRISIDKRTPGAAGAAKKSPHSLLQEYLNRSTEHLWGIVSNGETLRLLRDNVALTRQAYVEFDLKAMMDGEVYSDFALLWMLCHQSRLDAAKPEEFWLERWSKVAQDVGVRALDQLRDGVSKAIEALGGGFLGHRGNQLLRDKLAAGDLDKQEYYRQLLRIVYRLLFLFVAEDRELLLVGSPEAQQRYRTYYSTQRLRQLAASRRGTRHSDLYEQLRFVFGCLGREEGCEGLALKPLGSFLWSDDATTALNGCSLSNVDLLTAIRSLSVLKDGRVTRVVDFRNLRSEELGSVYEALLEMHPEVHLESGTFELKTAAGNERKTTGSYYTPEGLVQLLLNSALDSVLVEAAAKSDPEAAILALKICDPACGSGHFLIAAAHRIAKKLASVRTGDEEANPEAVRKALRDVIGHCIHGVDINPMAVELCKVALWMEALDPGRPLSFLEQKIQCGNSLLGVTPELLSKGIPDAAFDAIEGDDKEICKRAKAENKRYRETQQSTLDFSEPWNRLGDLATSLMQLDESSDETLADIRKKEARWTELVKSTGYLFGELWADSWCAAFVWRKTPDAVWPPTEETFRRIEHNPYAVDARVRAEIRRLAEQYQFFHWHIRFPTVFGLGKAAAGFDVLVGNPPWDRIKLQEKEWFAERQPAIATAATAAARERMIEELGETNPPLLLDFRAALRRSEGLSHFLRNSERFPRTGRGDVNTYAVFAELAAELVQARGCAGMLLPTAIALSETTSEFFESLLQERRLVALFSFYEIRRFFPGTDSRDPFCVLTFLGGQAPAPTKFAFDLHEISELYDVDRTYELSVEDIVLLNPNTRTCSIFRTRREAEIAKAIYTAIPVLVNEAATDGNPWRVSFSTLFHMSNDSDLFFRREALVENGFSLRGNRMLHDDSEYLPLYVAKMIDHYDHRYGSYERVRDDASENTPLPRVELIQHQNPAYVPLPKYWVAAADVKQRLGAKWSEDWMFGVRDVTKSSKERTVIGAVIPAVAAGNNLPLILPGPQTIGLFPCFVANMSSLVLDFVARQKLGGSHLNMFIAWQLPVLPPSRYLRHGPIPTAVELGRWITDRVVELVYTAADLASFGARYGYEYGPFTWEESRRAEIRAELDALFFHLYAIQRSDVEYIIDSFERLKTLESEGLGEYRTKRLVLEIYDRMQQAKDSGLEYQTILAPPPADPRVALPGYEQFETAVAADPWRDLADAAASEVWRLPPGVSYGNLVLFALIDVLKKFGVPVAQDTIRTAVALMTNPALAVAVLEPEEARHWIAAIGTDARPLPANVHRFTTQRGGIDHDWADAVARAKAGGLLIEDRAAGTWSLRPGAEGSGQPWMEGRAAVAVAIVKRFEPVELEQNLVRFANDVTDGKAARAVS